MNKVKVIYIKSSEYFNKGDRAMLFPDEAVKVVKKGDAKYEVPPVQIKSKKEKENEQHT